MNKLFVALVVLGMLVPAAWAQQRDRMSIAEQRRSLEATMLVNGTIDIEPDGSVSGYTLERAERLPPEVDQVVRNSVARWRFEPVRVDGVARPASAPMRLRLVARRDGDAYLVGIRDASFAGDVEADSSDRLRFDQQRPMPSYPRSAVEAGIPATVYVALEVGRDGKVHEAAVQQVNLHALVDRQHLDRVRQLFANATLNALRRWTFHVPTTGEDKDEPSWSAVIPVMYCVDGVRVCEGERYGRWLRYVPGPRTPPAWLDDDEAKRLSNTAIADNQLATGRETLRLLTPLDEG